MGAHLGWHCPPGMARRYRGGLTLVGANLGWHCPLGTTRRYRGGLNLVGANRWFALPDSPGTTRRYRSRNHPDASMKARTAFGSA
ncbi:hypothetical protein KMM349_31180 [Stenotrophomonas maltophilia]|nr:hypothetical protein KMM349_31180 [Stenotrophomonas maltophilia]